MSRPTMTPAQASKLYREIRGLPMTSHKLKDWFNSGIIKNASVEPSGRIYYDEEEIRTLAEG